MKFLAIFLLSFQSLIAQSNAEETILALEKKRFEALVNKDYVVLNQIFSDDLIYTHADGKKDTKNSFLEGLKDGRRTYIKIELDSIKVRIYPQMAILNGDVFFTRINKSGDEILQKLRYASVYFLKQKRWQMVSWHSSDITKK